MTALWTTVVNAILAFFAAAVRPVIRMAVNQVFDILFEEWGAELEERVTLLQQENDALRERLAQAESARLAGV